MADRSHFRNIIYPIRNLKAALGRVEEDVPGTLKVPGTCRISQVIYLHYMP